MQEGTASHTARSVAARRLEYDRLPAAYGDPGADLALARDVADGLIPRPGRMDDYIRARTAFFDRVVTSALDSGFGQVVVGAAGYDGRSLRYAKAGVRWFEVDHPATQADKLARLARLGLDASHVRFIAADFTADPVAARLRDAGLDPARPALFLFEGIAVYLEAAVTEAVLAQFRAVTAPGARLAISVSLTRPAGQPDTRAGFRARVADLGEPARSTLEAAEATALLARAGWAVDPPGEAADPARRARQHAAGLLTAHAAESSTAPRHPTGNLPRPHPIPAADPGVPSPAGAIPDPMAAPEGPPGAPARAAGRGAGTGQGEATAGRAVPARRALTAAAPGGAVPDDQDATDAGHADGARLPLPALLSRALVAFTIEADNEAERRLPHRTTGHGRAPGAPPDAPWLISLAMWASSLRHVPDAGITVEALRAAARTGTNLAGLRRWGYVTFDPEPTRGKQPARDAVVRLTGPGRQARDGWAPVGAVVEDRWRERFGPDVVAGLRETLASIAAQLPASLPDCLPILGHGLSSRPRGTAIAPAGHGALASGKPRAEGDALAAPSTAAPSTAAASLPTPPASPTSTDALAAPAPRLAGAAAAELPLWALLSRVLLAFAAQFEEQSPLALAACATVLRVLTEDGVRSRDVPALAGVSKEAVAMALGLLTTGGLAAEGSDPAGGRWRIARLTPRGARAQRASAELAAGIEDAWRARFGPAVDGLRAALARLPLASLLAGAAPYPEGWRARVPAPATLPHFPMVLHRGGYPDGS
ncbi:MAG TPA: SAM-dependent methyltransferase [Trebonia sp.]|nr:SAM-dependent methyltransferase [Trebonia sp.]